MPNHTIITDIAAHRAGWEQLYQGYAAFYKVEQTHAMRDRVWAWIGEGRITCLMALDTESRPVGIAHVREFLRPLSATVGGYLDDLFVDPDLRGTGAAADLFTAIKDLRDARGWSVIRWITSDNNYRARTLYDKLATKTPWLTYDLLP